MAQPPDTTIPPYRLLITGLNRNGPNVHIRRPDGVPDPLLILTLSGAGFFQGRGEETALEVGIVAVIPGRTPHDYGTAERAKGWTTLWTHFHPWHHWEDLLRWPRGGSGIGILNLNDSALYRAVERDLRRMHRHAVSAHPHRELLAMNALERALLRCDGANPSQAANRIDVRIQAVIEHIHTHLADPLTVGDLAGVAGISPSRFAHLFSEELDIPPLQYVEQQRLNRARALLTCTARSVAEIATETGFPDPFYFSRRFRKLTGLSPRNYRSRVTQGTGG